MAFKPSPYHRSSITYAFSFWAANADCRSPKRACWMEYPRTIELPSTTDKSSSSSHHYQFLRYKKKPRKATKDDRCRPDRLTVISLLLPATTVPFFWDNPFLRHSVKKSQKALQMAATQKLAIFKLCAPED